MATDVYKFTSESGVTEGTGGVATWEDTVEGYTLSQSVEADRPTYVADAHKGHPSVKGDGITKCLFNPNGRKIINGTNFPSGIVSFHTVMKINALSNLGRLYSTGYFSAGYIGILLNVVSNGIRSFACNNGASALNGRDSATDVLTAGDLITITQQYELNTNNHGIYLDGVNIASSSPFTANVADLGSEDSLALLAVMNTATVTSNPSNSELFEWRMMDGSVDAAALHTASMAYWDVEPSSGSSGPQDLLLGLS